MSENIPDNFEGAPANLQPAKPLEYEAPRERAAREQLARDQRPGPVAIAVAAICGFFIGFFGTCFFGVVFAEVAGTGRPALVLCGGCGGLLILVLFEIRRTLRTPAEDRWREGRGFMLGALIGMGLATLVDGACYVAMATSGWRL